MKASEMQVNESPEPNAVAVPQARDSAVADRRGPGGWLRFLR
jgi:hypothetical protein